MSGKDEFIYELKNASPIEEVVRSYVPLKRQGRNYVCNCPFHSEKTPSCVVYVDSQNFYCFGCHAGGDVINFVRMIENVEFIEALKILSDRAGLQMPEYSGKNKQFAERKNRIYEINRIAANFFYLNLIKGQNKAGLKYFQERKLSPQTIKKYGLGFASDSWNELTDYLSSKGYTYDEIVDSWLGGRSKSGKVFDMFRNRVMFPIVDLRGNIIGFGGRVLDDSAPKYLNTGKTPVFDKGSNLFSMNFAKNSNDKKIILCEGYMDVIALNQAGFENAVATLGTAITPEQARLISHYAEDVIVSYDSDEAGQNAAKKAVSHLSDVGVGTKILQMQGAKDPDEYIKKFGADRFRFLLEDSSDAVVFMIKKCENGLDISTERGKTQYLKRVSEVLAEIEQDIEREVYISSVSEKCGVSQEVIRLYVQGMMKKKAETFRRREWNDTVNSQVITYRDDINPESAKLKKQSNAEEIIIFWLIRHPEDIEIIVSKCPQDIFVTSFNKKVYSAILTEISQTENFSVSLLNETFTPQEMSRISAIQAEYRDKGINHKVFEDCVKVLEDYKSKKYKQDSDISDDDLRSLFKSKKH